jgi:hypothetical protein
MKAFLSRGVPPSTPLNTIELLACGLARGAQFLLFLAKFQQPSGPPAKLLCRMCWVVELLHK